MESKSDAPNWAETELLDLLARGMPAESLDLHHFSDETLLTRVREDNTRIAQILLANGRANKVTDSIDRDVNIFLDELQRRNEIRHRNESSTRAAGPVGRFIGRCLKFGRD